MKLIKSNIQGNSFIAFCVLMSSNEWDCVCVIVEQYKDNPSEILKIFGETNVLISHIIYINNYLNFYKS